MLAVLLATPIWAIVAVVIFAGGFGWLGLLSRRGSTARPSHRAGAVAGVIGVVSALALIGLSPFLGPAAVLIGLCLAVASPPFLRQVRATARRAPPGMNREQPPATTVEPAGPNASTSEVGSSDEDLPGSPVLSPAYVPPTYLPPASSCGVLSDAALCSAWRSSFIILQRHHANADLEREGDLVHLRQHYLDELERRNPAGFRRWLYAGARPASDPSRYITWRYLLSRRLDGWRSQWYAEWRDREGAAMTQPLEHVSFDKPDEVREGDNWRLELVNLAGGVQVGKITAQPGWRWSEHVKPVAGTDLCLAPHQQYQLSGRIHVVMEDGTELESGPGEITSLPPGHDAWVVGDEPVVAIDWQGASIWAKIKDR